MNNTENTANTLIGYCRVSSDQQGASGLGLEAQEAQIRAYCDAHGIVLADLVVEVDSAISGKRPVRFSTLERIARGEAGGIIVATQSRISRSVIETADLLEWTNRKQVRLVMLDCSLDTATPTGKMVATILSAVAENEADQISSRTTAALAAKRDRGEAITRPRVEGQVADYIRQLRSEGVSIRGIVQRLNDEAVPTVRGGKQWHTSAIQRTLGYKRPKTRVRACLPA